MSTTEKIAAETTPTPTVPIKKNEPPSAITVVCSMTSVKINAVKIALNTLHNAYKLKTNPPLVIGMSSQSHVPEQPYGIRQTVLGAFNRIQSTFDCIPDHVTFASLSCDVIAIENGIYLEDEEDDDDVEIPPALQNLLASTTITPPKFTHGMDFAVVMRYHVGTHTYTLGFSRGVAFPLDMVQEARQDTTHKTTVGSLLAARYKHTDTHDPHVFLCGESRVSILAKAVAQLLFN